MQLHSTHSLPNEYRIDGRVTRIQLHHTRTNTDYELLVDTDDLPRILATCRRIYPYVEPHKRSKLVYARFNHLGKTISFHRWLIDAPPGIEVDHWNKNGLDNRRQNLRLATRSENMSNRRMGLYKTRKLVMEHKSGTRWGAWVFLGEYRCEEEANLVYNEADAILDREGFWDLFKDSKVSRHDQGIPTQR